MWPPKKRKLNHVPNFLIQVVAGTLTKFDLHLVPEDSVTSSMQVSYVPNTIITLKFFIVD